VTTTIKPAEIREWDRIVITGQASSPHKRYVKMPCVVSTVSADGFVKVWPDDERDGGKVWFSLAGIEEVELVDRE
jgi:hypothetical protein